jgi:hypothetical protein
VHTNAVALNEILLTLVVGNVVGSVNLTPKPVDNQGYAANVGAALLDPTATALPVADLIANVAEVPVVVNVATVAVILVGGRNVAAIPVNANDLVSAVSVNAVAVLGENPTPFIWLPPALAGFAYLAPNPVASDHEYALTTLEAEATILSDNNCKPPRPVETVGAAVTGLPYLVPSPAADIGYTDKYGAVA